MVLIDVNRVRGEDGVDRVSGMSSVSGVNGSWSSRVSAADTMLRSVSGLGPSLLATDEKVLTA